MLLSLEAFTTETSTTPKAKRDLAKDRLKDWRERGKQLNKEQAAADKGNLSASRSPALSLNVGSCEPTAPSRQAQSTRGRSTVV